MTTTYSQLPLSRSQETMRERGHCADKQQVFLCSVCLKQRNHLRCCYKSRISHMHSLDDEVIVSVIGEEKRQSFLCEILFCIIKFIFWKKYNYMYNVLQKHDIIENTTLYNNSCSLSYTQCASCGQGYNHYVLEFCMLCEYII